MIFVERLNLASTLRQPALQAPLGKTWGEEGRRYLSGGESPSHWLRRIKMGRRARREGKSTFYSTSVWGQGTCVWWQQVMEWTVMQESWSPSLVALQACTHTHTNARTHKCLVQRGGTQGWFWSSPAQRQRQQTVLVPTCTCRYHQCGSICPGAKSHYLNCSIMFPTHLNTSYIYNGMFRFPFWLHCFNKFHNR